MTWESINRMAARAAFLGAESGTIVFSDSSSVSVKLIIDRDVAIQPSDSAFESEVVAFAMDNIRSQIDIWKISEMDSKSVVNSTLTTGDESWLVEKIIAKDPYIIQTLARRLS